MPAEHLSIAADKKLKYVAEQAAEHVLQTSGGGPTMDSMEGRVTRLEVEFEHVRRDLDEIKHDQRTILDKIQGVTDLPSKSFLVVTVLSILGLCIGSVGVIAAILAYVGALPLPGVKQ